MFKRSGKKEHLRFYSPFSSSSSLKHQQLSDKIGLYFSLTAQHGQKGGLLTGQYGQKRETGGTFGGLAWELLTRGLLMDRKLTVEEVGRALGFLFHSILPRCPWLKCTRMYKGRKSTQHLSIPTEEEPRPPNPFPYKLAHSWTLSDLVLNVQTSREGGRNI